MPKEISRRDFLKTSAVSTVGVAALGLMGGCSSAAISGDSASLTESATTPATEDNVPAWLGEVPSITDTNISEVWNTEILIVGAGNGGLTAAAKASDLGMDFRLIEQNSLVQDTRGWYGAINTQECLDSGYKVDIPLLRSEISRYASGKLDQRVLNVWINESRAMHEYIKPLMEEAGYKLVFSADTGVEDSTGTPYYCSPQEHFYADNKGAVSKARNPLLQARIERNGYGINFNTSLVKLITSGNKVTGAIAQNTDTGAYIKINASHAVILATGGYPGNPEMVASLNPMIPACVTACSFSPSNRGQGIKAGLWAGASMDLEPAAMIFDRGLVAPGVDAGYVVDANGNKTFPGTVKQFNPGTQPFLKVNRDGERFANENSPYNDISHAASLQKGGVYCQIFDSGILEDVKGFHTLGCSALTRNLGPALMAEGGMVDEQVKADLVKKANTLEELADMLGFTGESRKIFLATIKRYNELYDAQEDQDFGKSAYRLSAIRKAPFYGLWLGGSLLTTIDGLSINADMQVLNKAKEPIIGLYATGDCSGSLFADNYPELMPGMAVGRTMTFALHIINKLKADGVTTGLTGNGVAKTSAESSVASAQNCKDGTYTASSPGIGGDVKVTVTIKSGKIVECTVDAAAETPTLGGAAAPQLAEKIISANGTNGVDAVSGSTITSQAVIKAVQKCLVQAAG